MGAAETVEPNWFVASGFGFRVYRFRGLGFGVVWNTLLNCCLGFRVWGLELLYFRLRPVPGLDSLCSSFAGEKIQENHGIRTTNTPNHVM